MNISDQIEALFESVAAGAAAEAGRPAVGPLDFLSARGLITGAVLREFDRLMTHRDVAVVETVVADEHVSDDEQPAETATETPPEEEAAKTAETVEDSAKEEHAAPEVAEQPDAKPEAEQQPAAEAEEKTAEGGAA